MRRLLDALLLAWVLTWLLAGIAVGREVRGLSEVSDRAREAGVATQRAADVLDTLSALPLVGGAIAEPAATLREAGESAVAGAEEGRERTQTLGLLLGIAIAVVPSVPLLVLHLPGRIRFERERSLVRDRLRDGRDAGLDELLATRAVARLPLTRLHEISDDPIADLHEGHHAALADAELARLELSVDSG